MPFILNTIWRVEFNLKISLCISLIKFPFFALGCKYFYSLNLGIFILQSVGNPQTAFLTLLHQLYFLFFKTIDIYTSATNAFSNIIYNWELLFFPIVESGSVSRLLYIRYDIYDTWSIHMHQHFYVFSQKLQIIEPHWCHSYSNKSKNPLNVWLPLLPVRPVSVAVCYRLLFKAWKKYVISKMDKQLTFTSSALIRSSYLLLHVSDERSEQDQRLRWGKGVCCI